MEVDETWKAWHFRGEREGDALSPSSSSFSCMTQFPAQATHTVKCPSVFQEAHPLKQLRALAKGRAEGRKRRARWTTTKGAPHPFVYILCTFGSGRRGPPPFPSSQPSNKAHFIFQNLPLASSLPPAPLGFKKREYWSALTINICAAFSNCSMSDGAGRRDCHLPSVARHHGDAHTNTRSPTHVDVTFQVQFWGFGVYFQGLGLSEGFVKTRYLSLSSECIRETGPLVLYLGTLKCLSSIFEGILWSLRCIWN